MFAGQIETPSNAGIDAINNKNLPGSSTSSSSSTGGPTSSGGVNVNPEDFSYTLSGKAAHGIKVGAGFKPTPTTKTSAIITLNSKSLESFNGKEILVSTNFPTDVIKVIPSSFTIGKRNKIKMLIQIKSKESLRDIISGSLPDKINFFLNLELDGSEVIRKVMIPVVYLD